MVDKIIYLTAIFKNKQNTYTHSKQVFTRAGRPYLQLSSVSHAYPATGYGPVGIQGNTLRLSCSDVTRLVQSAINISRDLAEIIKVCSLYLWSMNSNLVSTYISFKVVFVYY